MLFCLYLKIYTFKTKSLFVCSEIGTYKKNGQIKKLQPPSNI